MDALDERLVTLLRHDARRSVSDLAVDLGVSRATVFRRSSTACWSRSVLMGSSSVLLTRRQNGRILFK